MWEVEVLPDYVDELDMLAMDTQGEANAEELVQDVAVARAERESAFLTRKRKVSSTGKEGTGAWRPQKRFRKSSMLHIGCIDQKLQSINPALNLKYFAQPDQVVGRKPWWSWPLLSLVTDQGSPEVCAAGFLESEVRLNIDIFYDMAHGLHNDFNRMLNKCNCWSHACMKLNEWNVQHGPWGEDVRQAELQGCWPSIFKNYTRPEDCPFCMQLLPRMMEDAQDFTSFGDPHVADKYWQGLKLESPFRRKGCNTVMNRFLTYLGKGQEEMGRAAKKLVGFLCCCIEQDYVGASKLTQLQCQGTH